MTSIRIDPRTQAFAILSCPSCGGDIELTHKTLRLQMWKKQGIIDRHPKVTPYHELTQLAEVPCPHCHQAIVITYDFEEFAMSAFAFEVKSIAPVP